MLESNKGLGLLKVIVNGIEITDSETWDRVVKSITEKDNEIAQLKSELEELKKNAIVPKFKVSDTKWYIEKNPYNDSVLQAFIGKIVSFEFEMGYGFSYMFDTGYYFIDETDIYDTKKQAEEALRKLEEK